MRQLPCPGFAGATMAAAWLLAASPAAGSDFGGIGGLAQSEFRELSRDLGAAFSYKGVTPATPLGTLGVDVGLEVTETRMENSRLFALAGAGDTSRVTVPKLHVHKGLPLGLDVSAFVAGVPDLDASLFGASVQWSYYDEGWVLPALGLRLAGTRATGTGDVKLSTGSVDVLVSKRLAIATPYAGAGTVRIRSSAGGAGLAAERLDQGRIFGGVNLNLLAVNLAFEVEKAGDNTSFSAKLGWRF